jgi:hypothetical protein
MITINQAPAPYTPSNNPIIWAFSSDNAAISFFQVQVLASDNSVITNLRLYTSPDNRLSSFIDLSPILKNTVDYQLLPSANITDNPANMVQAYKLVIIEKLYTANGIINGTTTVTNLYYTWEGELNSIAFNSFDYQKFTLRTISGETAAFLTNKPNYCKVNSTTSEYLYTINENLTQCTINYRLYSESNQLYGNYIVSGITLSNASRIDVSPATISNHFQVNLSPVKFYTVQITDRDNVAKTKPRVYMYEHITCQKQPVTLLWGNKVGGFDSFNFYAPRETINVTKTTIAKNPYKFNSNGTYTNVSSNVMNEDTSVINVASTSTYKLVTEPLRDVESVWLKELIQSPKVYVKLPNSVMMPVQITTSNYPVLQRRYQSTLMRLEIEISAPTGIDLAAIPDAANNYNPPTLPYIEVDAYCFDDTDTPSFGYIFPDANGNTIA